MIRAGERVRREQRQIVVVDSGLYNFFDQNDDQRG